MADETFKPEAGSGGANTSCDDITTQESANALFDTLRDAAGGSATADTTAGNAGFFRGAATTDRYDRLDRGIFTIDVSGFTGASGDVTGVTFGLYITIKSDQLGTGHSIGLVASAPADVADIATGDYDSLGVTRLATDLTISGITINQLTYFTLNAAGITAVKTAIDGDGIVKLGTRFDFDIDDSEVSLTWANDEFTRIYVSMADNATAAQRPVLTITYSSSDIKTVNGLAKASVKTYDGLAIASVKNINGLA